MEQDDSASVHSEVIQEIKEEKRQKMESRISFWLSFVLATAVTFWYFQANPQESAEVTQMRSYFKKNNRKVMEFIRMKEEQQLEFAKGESHPFFKTYLKASVNEKEKIRALIHVSVDYSPNQYWFNLVFLWLIAFTTVWFIALMAQGVLMVVRNKQDVT